LNFLILGLKHEYTARLAAQRNASRPLFRFFCRPARSRFGAPGFFVFQDSKMNPRSLPFTWGKWLLAMVLAGSSFYASASCNPTAPCGTLEFAFPERLTPAEQAERDRKNAEAEAARKAEADRKEAAIKALGLPPHRRAEAERLYEMRKQAEAARGGPFATAQPKPEPKTETAAQAKPETKPQAQSKANCTYSTKTESAFGAGSTQAQAREIAAGAISRQCGLFGGVKSSGAAKCSVFDNGNRLVDERKPGSTVPKLVWHKKAAPEVHHCYIQVTCNEKQAFCSGGSASSQ
jgi:hypothetical protein